jgi:hypothetical protein
MASALAVVIDVKHHVDNTKVDDLGWQNAQGDASENLLRFIYKLKRRVL